MSRSSLDPTPLRSPSGRPLPRLSPRRKLVRRPSSTGYRLDLVGDAGDTAFSERFLEEITSQLKGDLERCVVIDIRELDGVMPLYAWRSLKALCDRKLTRLGILATAVQLAKDTQLQLASMTWGGEFRVFHTELGADAWAASRSQTTLRPGAVR
ncbi:MAG: hypothetical protein HOV80_13950 [Polyangiaceae bacterium]|nr:hypothetical protein [Polyangiaceae bacterium]